VGVLSDPRFKAGRMKFSLPIHFLSTDSKMKISREADKCRKDTEVQPMISAEFTIK
jgi:hypothetical protein